MRRINNQIRLLDALRLSEYRSVGSPGAPSLAFAGAGGKTSAIFCMAREILDAGYSNSVFVTTTTHLGIGQLGLADRHEQVESSEDLAGLETGAISGVIALMAPLSRLAERESGYAVAGLDGESLERLHALAQRLDIPLLIEADGSRLRPLKAPAAHEPAVPGWVDTVVVVAGLKGLGLPLSEVMVHRPEIFSALTGIAPGEAITPGGLVRLLNHPAGGLKNIPAQSRRLVLFNTQNADEQLPHVQAMAMTLLNNYDAVLAVRVPTAAALRSALENKCAVEAVHEKVAGVILAAGAAQRFGEGSGRLQAKQLLPWRGEPLVRHVARSALASGLDPVIVVTGAFNSEVQRALDGLPVYIAHNPSWSEGQSQSILAGLRFRIGDRMVAKSTGAAVFMLADQPQIPPMLVRLLVEQHAGSLAPIVAPLVAGRRANPVLFDRRTFQELMSLSGDTGGRGLFQRYPVSWVPWLDESVLLDVDTPEDYERLQQL